MNIAVRYSTSHSVFIIPISLNHKLYLEFDATTQHTV